MQNEEISIKSIQEGDSLAFRRFVESHSPKLYYYAYGIVGDKRLAEEVVGDVFVEVWNHREKLDTIKNIVSWMFTITQNKSISLLRKRAERIHLSLDEIDGFFISPFQNPEDEVISCEELERINKAIEMLPTKCKQVFLLAKFENQSYKEIAEILNISVKTVNNHITYALKEIIKALKNTD